MGRDIKIASFDVSSVSTGWSIIKGDKLMSYGIIDIDKKIVVNAKLCIFAISLLDILHKYKPKQVVIEDTYLKNVKTLKTLMQFIGVLNYLCKSKFKIDINIVNPNSVRSFFKVKGKEDAISVVNTLCETCFEFKDNDITDSILQGLYYYYKYIIKLEEFNG